MGIKPGHNLLLGQKEKFMSSIPSVHSFSEPPRESDLPAEVTSHAISPEGTQEPPPYSPTNAQTSQSDTENAIEGVSHEAHGSALQGSQHMDRPYRGLIEVTTLLLLITLLKLREVMSPWKQR
jgi:hypothetical protein